MENVNFIDKPCFVVTTKSDKPCMLAIENIRKGKLL